MGTEKTPGRFELARVSTLMFSPTPNSAFLRVKWDAADPESTFLVVRLASNTKGECYALNGKFTRVSVSQLVCLAEVKPGTDCDWELQDETIRKRDERRADLERQKQGS